MGHFSEDALTKFNAMCADGVDFSEKEVYDFTRCVRADGTFYGTAGRCRKGSQTASKAKELSAPKAKPSRDENIAKLRSLVKTQKESGATRRNLKNLRGKLQIEESTRKLEREAAKTGKDLKQIAAEKAEASNRKADQALLKKAKERLASAISEGNAAGERNYRIAVERLTEKLSKK